MGYKMWKQNTKVVHKVTKLWKSWLFHFKTPLSTISLVTNSFSWIPNAPKVSICNSSKNHLPSSQQDTQVSLQSLNHSKGWKMHPLQSSIPSQQLSKYCTILPAQVFSRTLHHQLYPITFLLALPIPSHYSSSATDPYTKLPLNSGTISTEFYKISVTPPTSPFTHYHLS